MQSTRAMQVNQHRPLPRLHEPDPEPIDLDETFYK
jgi:hypothetical protein